MSEGTILAIPGEDYANLVADSGVTVFVGPTGVDMTLGMEMVGHDLANTKGYTIFHTWEDRSPEVRKWGRTWARLDHKGLVDQNMVQKPPEGLKALVIHNPGLFGGGWDKVEAVFKGIVDWSLVHDIPVVVSIQASTKGNVMSPVFERLADAVYSVGADQVLCRKYRMDDPEPERRQGTIYPPFQTVSELRGLYLEAPEPRVTMTTLRFTVHEVDEWYVKATEEVTNDGRDHYPTVSFPNHQQVLEVSYKDGEFEFVCSKNWRCRGNKEVKQDDGPTALVSFIPVEGTFPGQLPKRMQILGRAGKYLWFLPIESSLLSGILGL